MGLLGFRIAFYLSQQPILQSIYKFLFFKRPRDSVDILVEPIETNHWFCEFQLFPFRTTFSKLSSYSFLFKKTMPISVFDFREHYLLPPFSDQHLKEKLTDIHNNCRTIDNEKSLFLYSLPVMIDNHEKVFRIIKQNYFSPEKLSCPLLSSVSFLDIQYRHPEMKDSLILEIPKDWCCVGNELFTPAFVLRMLYYQILPFQFDMRYTLDIMDNELNMFTLNPRQFICLKETGYELMEYI
jgi:hypothetical protein